MVKIVRLSREFKEAYELIDRVKEELGVELPLEIKAAEEFLKIRIGPSFIIDATDYAYVFPYQSKADHQITINALKHYGFSFSIPKQVEEFGSEQHRIVSEAIFGEHLSNAIEIVLLGQHLNGYSRNLIMRDCLKREFANSNPPRGRVYHKQRLIKHTEYFDLIMTNEEDQLANLTPLVRHFGKRTDQLRSLFGKNTWKKIANRPVEQNHLFVEFLEILEIEGEVSLKRGIHTVRSYLELPVSYQEIFVEQAELSSINYYRCAGFVQLLVNIQSESNSCPHRAMQILFDTRDYLEQAEKLGLAIERLSTIKHLYLLNDVVKDEVHRQYIEKECSRQPFENVLINIDSSPSFTFYKAQLLNSEYLLKREGYLMRHCVGDYVSRVQSGSHIIYHMSKTSTHQSLTVSFRFDYEQQKFVRDQVFGPSNKPNQCDNFAAFIQLIEEQLQGLELNFIPDDPAKLAYEAIMDMHVPPCFQQEGDVPF